MVSSSELCVMQDAWLLLGRAEPASPLLRSAGGSCEVDDLLTELPVEKGVYEVEAPQLGSAKRSTLPGVERAAAPRLGARAGSPVHGK
jgi:hypothetical protein